MAKNIRWQIPFVSLTGTRYRVDIYDEGTFTPVQLTAGPTPFVTDEDASDDFFCPVRSQSGTLQVCTLMPDGNYITLDELLPANNIARPVRLINRDNSNAIEWQGFLSCEAYSQDYMGIPQILDLPLIGVLEAMDSINLDISLAGIMTVRQMIANIFAAMTNTFNISQSTCYANIYTSFNSYSVLEEYTPTTQFFSDKVVDSWTKRTHVIDYMSCKEILNRICTFMGWVAREQGCDLYFQRITESVGMTKETYNDFIVNSTKNYIALTTQDLSNSEWRGTGHQRSVSAGAKSVEVVANLGEISLDMGNPEFKDKTLTMWTSYLYTLDTAQGSSPSGQDAFEHGEVFDNTVDELVKLYVYTTTQQYIRSGSYINWRWYAAATEQNVPGNLLSHSIIGGASYTLNLDETNKTIGSFYLRGIKWNKDDEKPEHYNEGVYISGLPANSIILNFYDLFRMRSAIPLFASGGKIKINMEGFGLARNYYSKYTSGEATGYYSGVSRFGTRLEARDFIIYCRLKIGDKYYNGTSWVTKRSVFTVQITDEKAEKEINVPNSITGVVEFYIVQGCGSTRYLRYTDDGTNYEDRDYQIEDYFFSSIEVAYDPGDPEYGVRDVNENHYLMDLHTAFRDEISISTNIASNLNNKQSISFLYDDADCKKRMESLLYRSSISSPSTGYKQRPEQDLLNRLAAYYGAARQRLELEVAHPTAAPLPLLKLNGINYCKVYLPLSESRDWQTGVCKLTCFETPS